jgi:hypothetical protein
MLVVPQRALVAGVSRGEGAKPDLLCPVQPAEAMLPEANPVPAGSGRRSAGGRRVASSKSPFLSVLPSTSLWLSLLLLHWST